MSGENRKERKKKVNLGACGPRNYKYKFLCQLQIFKYKGNKGHWRKLNKIAMPWMTWTHDEKYLIQKESPATVSLKKS